MRTTIDPAGRIVVPKVLRDELGLTGGQELEIAARDGRLEIDLLAVPMRLEDVDGLPSATPASPLPTLTAAEVRRTLERIRR